MRGTWEDFTTKWGFGDGEQVEPIDYKVRDLLIERLNSLPEMKRSSIRAVAYDCPGLHNPCMIVLLPVIRGKKDDGRMVFDLDAYLMKMWVDGEIGAVSLPECSVDETCEEYWDIEQMITDAYIEAIKKEAYEYTGAWEAVDKLDWKLPDRQSSKLSALFERRGEISEDILGALDGVLNFLDALLDEAETKGLYNIRRE